MDKLELLRRLSISSAMFAVPALSPAADLVIFTQSVALHVNLDKTAELSRETFTA
jgi:hypothetical protein